MAQRPFSLSPFWGEGRGEGITKRVGCAADVPNHTGDDTSLVTSPTRDLSQRWAGS